MRLYSIQGHNLCEFRGKIDRSKSPYKEDKVIMSAYDELYRLLGTDQFIWCSQSTSMQEQRILDEHEHIHTIELADEDIIGIVNTFIWMHIISPDGNYIPAHFYGQISCQAAIDEQGDPSLTQDALIVERVAKHIEDNLPKDLWACVLRKDSDIQKDDQYLLRYPLESSKIVSVTRSQDYSQRIQRTS